MSQIMNIDKNRKRQNYTFANINLLGKCNLDCYFCLGKDLKYELKGKNQLRTHFKKWKNFHKFIEYCKQHGIEKLYLTGQTADALQYKYIPELRYFLEEKNGFTLGIRSNGLLAIDKQYVVKEMKGEIGYTIQSLWKDTFNQITGNSANPDWTHILNNSGSNLRVSIVINRFNYKEIDAIIKYLSCFKDIKYIQLRRVSTDRRIDELAEDMELFEVYYNKTKREYPVKDRFNLAEIFEIHGKDVVFWRTVQTDVNSLNYFTDGTISDEYFIVEGYLKNSTPKPLNHEPLNC